MLGRQFYRASGLKKAAFIAMTKRKVWLTPLVDRWDRTIHLGGFVSNGIGWVSFMRRWKVVTRQLRRH